MAELNKLEENLKNLYDTKVKIGNVVQIFNEYFGEELVDAQYVKTFEMCLSDLYLYNDIGELFNYFCAVSYSSYGTDIYTVKIANLSIDVTKDTYENLIKLPVKDNIPEPLYPIVEAIWLQMLPFYADIIVRFPNVTVTNEYDKSIDIQELYVKTRVTNEGKLISRFTCIRAFYYIDQWESDYCHSHIPRISKDWEEPCTGTGPINSTMDSLYSNYSEDIWGLFCYELDKFVRVESISGVPYRRLESVGLKDTSPVAASNMSLSGSANLAEVLDKDAQKDLIMHIINNMPIKIAYSKNHYVLGESIIKTWIRISREFANWYNNKYNNKKKASLVKLLAYGVVGKYIYENGCIYRVGMVSRRNMSEYEGADLLTFKGHSVKMHIEDNSKKDNDNNYVYLVSPVFVNLLINRILLVLNYNYGRKETTTTEEDQTSNKGRIVYF